MPCYMLHCWRRAQRRQESDNVTALLTWGNDLYEPFCVLLFEGNDQNNNSLEEIAMISIEEFTGKVTRSAAPSWGHVHHFRL